MKKKFTHTKALHAGLEHRRDIAKTVLSVIPQKVNNVLDVGCGLGSLLYCFKELGVENVLGVDGEWADKRMISDFLTDEEFQVENLEIGFRLDEEYDLVVCLEVAEHVSKDGAENLVGSLVSSGNIVAFSAAIPFQGGDNHINEQWASYWQSLFAKHGFILHDVLRPILWNKESMPSWYKQNMVIFAKEGIQLKDGLIVNPLTDVVHYQSFRIKEDQLYKMINGEYPSRVYLTYLIKSLIGKKTFDKLVSILK